MDAHENGDKMFEQLKPNENDEFSEKFDKAICRAAIYHGPWLTLFALVCTAYTHIKNAPFKDLYVVVAFAVATVTFCLFAAAVVAGANQIDRELRRKK